ncbi:MAG: sigma-70 family RNA polymerase sigma factor [Acidobacteria bacterium]|nr:sigma-70 family RNA polymerase sigma factor [Acidobacteriota bacterium]
MSPGASGTEPPDRPALSTESTASLLNRLKAGESAARDILLSRYLLPLRKWAHGRLPAQARDLMDTDDLVQDTVLRTLRQLDGLLADGDGVFLAYMRQTLLNKIKDQIRHLRRQPGRGPLLDTYPDGNPSPLQFAVGEETLMKYDKAMLALPQHQQEAIMLRVEMGFSYEEIARFLGCPSANAARMLVARTLLRLATAMKVADGKPG